MKQKNQKEVSDKDVISSYMQDEDHVVLLLNGEELSSTERRRYLNWSRKQHKGKKG